MGKKYKSINGIPIPGGLTEAEYQRIRRSPSPAKTIKDMGKKPDEKWLKEVLKVWAKTF